ncbi:unnamed protein product [Allacma fusca]|uniref:Cytochrome P450 n=1 Tax=Allacma fusca TaxID=39272 RepID=A0A8J2JUF3_9HEXA|nr:unnamed protein product [Allacma fusca]
MSTLLWIVGAIGAIAYAVYKYLDGNGDYWTELGVDSLAKGELASFLDRITFKVGFTEYDKKCYERFSGLKYGGIVEFRKPALYVRDPELIKRVLVKDFNYFLDRRILDLNQKDILFSKMLTSKTGKEWKDLRSTMSPTFSTGKIKRMFEHFNTCGSKFADYLKEVEKTENQVDFQDVFGRYTVAVIASIVFGIETDVFTNDASYFRRMAVQSRTFSFARMIKLFLLFTSPPLGKLLGVSFSDTESTDFFDTLIQKNIQKRRENQEKREDFLQIMLEAQAGQTKIDESELSSFEKDAVLKDTIKEKKDLAVVLDDETVVAQALLFFLAGFDTVESLLVFTAYELALNPEVQEKLADEVIPVLEESQGVLKYEDTQNLEYLDMVISETLRHHPPAFATERQCTETYQVPETNLILPKGMRVIVPINSIQHDARYYPEPEKFNPEHFSAENKAKRHPYTYLPFGQGPRNCIAMRFALTEAKAAIAHLVYNFKIEPGTKTEIPLKISSKHTVKKPANGVWLKFQTRESTSEGFVKL